MDVESAGSFSEVLTLQQNQAAADASLGLTFEEIDVEDEAASRAEGRPVFKTRHLATIRIPGDKDNAFTFWADKMNADERRRFGKRYQEWKETHTNKVEGTLLREWGLMSRARGREWEALNVFTVEQLAALSDANLQNMRGGNLERQKARDFLEFAKGQAPLIQARAENEKMKAQMSALQEQVDKLTKLLEERTEPTPRKGR